MVRCDLPVFVLRGSYSIRVSQGVLTNEFLRYATKTYEPPPPVEEQEQPDDPHRSPPPDPGGGGGGGGHSTSQLDRGVPLGGSKPDPVILRSAHEKYTLS